MDKMQQSTQTTLSDTNRQYLATIGLSQDAVKLYELVLRHGPLTAQAAANYTGAFASAEYRLFYELEARGLVRRLDGRPRQFASLTLRDGLQASLAVQEATLQSLVAGDGYDESQTVLIGRQALYEAYMHYASQAKDSICIYAIGIAYSEALAKTQAAARARGVNVRHVVQEVQVSNYFVISRWQQLGIALRSLKRSRGFHLMIIDDAVVLVTFSDPKDTDHRVTMVTKDTETIAIFQAQFESIWSRARTIPSLER